MIYVLFAAYNEAAVISPFLTSIKREMESRGEPYLIIGSTDGSTDNTAEIAADHAHEMPLQLIPQIQERGLGIAFRRVIEEVCRLSTGDDDIAFFVDADSTCDLSYSSQLVDAVRKGADVAIASRYTKGGGAIGFPFYRRILSHGAALFFRIFFPIKGIREYTCSYRAYSLKTLKKAWQAFPDSLITEREFCCFAELLIKMNTLGAVFKEIPFVLDCTAREGGESKMNAKKVMLATFKMAFALRRYAWR